MDLTVFQYFLSRLDAIHPRHLNVHQYQLVMSLRELHKPLLPVRGLIAPLAQSLQHYLQGVDVRELVVHDKDLVLSLTLLFFDRLLLIRLFQFVCFMRNHDPPGPLFHLPGD